MRENSLIFTITDQLNTGTVEKSNFCISEYYYVKEIALLIKLN